MTPSPPWHPPESALQGYVDGQSSLPLRGSVEAHLLACAPCRAAVGHGVPADRLARIRAGVEDRVEVLGRPRTERLLLRLGLPEADARALLAAPALRAAWWLAVAGASVLAAMNLRSGRDPHLLFLLLAPLLPVATTALAYAPGLDPALPHVAATPYSTTRMLLARSGAVAVTALLGVGLAALALPQQDLLSVAWLVPAVALTLSTLALSPRLGAVPAASAVAGAWIVGLLLLHRWEVDLRDVLGSGGQLAVAVVGLVALLVVRAQHGRLEGGRTS